LAELGKQFCFVFFIVLFTHLVGLDYSSFPLLILVA
jgi:hypothetical protein